LLPAMVTTACRMAVSETSVAYRRHLTFGGCFPQALATAFLEGRRESSR